MNLPNYFLADLPPEAQLSPALITEACQTLKRNRERYLEGRTTDAVIRILDSVGRDWLQPEDPFRLCALADGPAATGFSEPILRQGIDQFFAQLTAENIETLLDQDLGHSRRLDQFHPNESETAAKRLAWARGPNLLAHFAPSNIPVAALSQMVMGLLTRSAQFVKCGSGQAFLPRLFAHSLYQAESKLGACLEIASWKGGSEPLEKVLCAEADCIVLTGGDEAAASLRRHAPATARFIAYGTRVSFALVTRAALDRHAKAIARHAAHDVAAWDQLGCLSPHVIYIEGAAANAAEEFAKMIADELAAIERTHPRGAVRTHDAAAIAQRRAFYEVRAAHSVETKMWMSRESTAWTVILEADARFQVSCLNRFVYVKAVASVDEALQGADPMREKVSTIGVACSAAEGPDLALRLARWGASRVCALGEMQNPPLSWRHDGRPALGDLVTWCDWER